MGGEGADKTTLVRAFSAMLFLNARPKYLPIEVSPGLCWTLRALIATAPGRGVSWKA